MKKHSFKISRTIAAPRAKVYARWTNLKAAKKTAPEGCTNQKFESDFRVGGDYRTVMKTPHGVMKNKGQYLEIVPGKKIVQTFIWDQPDTEVNFIAIRFKDRGARTEVELRATGFEIKGEAEGNKQGWASTLEVFARSFQ